MQAVRMLAVALAMARFAAVQASGELPECRHTFPDGNTFDLSGLRKPPMERDWYADDRSGNMYYFNMCADANEVPEACVALSNAVAAPVYEVTKAGDCFWLGLTKSMEWELIDETEPAAGVELYYFDGEQCAGGVARDVRVQLFCDPDAGVGKPLDYYVLEEDCHYSITWPSKYGCPVGGAGAFLGISFGSFWTWVLLAALVYVGVGMAQNVSQGAAVGVEALPHKDFWMHVTTVAVEGLSLAREKIGEVLGRRKAAYERVDGVEYEWG